MHRPLVSVVFSFRNEQENIPPLLDRLTSMFAAVHVQYELIFVNDASTDGSLALLADAHRKNPRVKVVTLARRFGVAEGVRAGMAAARGDAVVYMDADLQDPPEVIPQLIDAWQKGADVVHTVRTRRRGESPIKMGLTAIAYRIIRAGSSIQLPVDAGDFKLLSRRAVTHLLALNESDPYMRGLVTWIGFNQVLLPYERAPRHGGTTHFPFFSRNPWKTFALGLTSFSFMPIYVVLAIAAGGLTVSAITLATGLVMWFNSSPHRDAVLFLGLITFFWATTVGAVTRRGRYLLGDLSSNETLLMHLGMSGSIARARARPPSMDIGAARPRRCSRCRPARRSSSTIRGDLACMDLDSGAEIDRRARRAERAGARSRSRDTFDAEALARALPGQATDCAESGAARSAGRRRARQHLRERGAASGPAVAASARLHPRWRPSSGTAARQLPVGSSIAIKSRARSGAISSTALGRCRSCVPRFRVYDRAGEALPDVAGVAGDDPSDSRQGRTVATFHCPVCQQLAR